MYWNHSGTGGQKNISIDYFLSAETPQIVADKTQIKQVVLNLLSNAVKYNIESGNIKVEEKTQDNEYLIISVSDTGLGISASLQSNLFKPFHRAGNENSNIPGTGLGLAITKQLIESMHGSIGFESKKDRGSVFWIRIPISLSDEAPLIEDYTSTKNKTINEERDFNLLHIEDNTLNIKHKTNGKNNFDSIKY